MKHSSIFKSRWMALLWSAGILWFAYDTAEGSKPSQKDGASEGTTDVTGAPVTPEQEEKFAEIINGL